MCAHAQGEWELEEREDRESALTLLLLHGGGSVEAGYTSGPPPLSSCGTWAERRATRAGWAVTAGAAVATAVEAAAFSFGTWAERRATGMAVAAAAMAAAMAAAAAVA